MYIIKKVKVIFFSFNKFGLKKVTYMVYYYLYTFSSIQFVFV